MARCEIRNGISCGRVKKSFSDWKRARFGKTLSMHLNEKYAEKLWKMPVHKLSGDWASTRVGGFKLKDFLLGLFSKLGYQRAYSQSHPDSDWFYYSDEGTLISEF